MNDLGRIVMGHWERFRPKELMSLREPESYFTTVGEQAEQDVLQISEEILRSQPASEDYLAEVSRRTTARATAREMVLADLLSVPDEETKGEPEMSLRDRLVDPSGMPWDRSHPLWADLDDETVSPSEFQKRCTAWIESLPTR